MLDGLTASPKDLLRLGVGGLLLLIWLAAGIGPTQAQSGSDAAVPAAANSSGADTKDAQSLEEATRLKRLEESLATATAGSADPALYDDYLALGLRYSGLGNFQAAEKAYRFALEAAEKRQAQEQEARTSEVLLRLATMVSNQGRFEESAPLLQRARRAIEAEGDATSYSRYLAHVAIDLANRREFEQAFQQARAANRRLMDYLVKKGRPPKDGGKAQAVYFAEMTELGHALLLESVLARRIDRNDEASLAASLARRIWLQNGNMPDNWLAILDTVIGAIAADKGDFEEAEKRMQLALIANRRAFGEARPAAISYLDLASVNEQFGNYDEALKSARRAVSLIEDEIAQGQGFNMVRLAAYLSAAYKKAEDADSEERTQLYNEMFSASQLVRAGATAATIASTAARLGKADNAQGRLLRDMQEAQRIRDQIRLELGKVAATPPERRRPGQFEALRSEFVRLDQEARRLEREVDEKFPEYAKLVQSKPVTAEQLGQMMASDEALLYFALNRKASYVFLIRGGVVHPAPLSVNSEQIDSLVALLRRAFHVDANGNIELYRLGLAANLYKFLIGPVQEHLVGVKHLVAVPSGSLLSLPFVMLLTDDPVPQADGEDVLTNYTRQPWLGKTMATSLLPSIRSFADLRGVVKPSTAGRAFVGFGNPTFEGNYDGASFDDLAGQCRTDEPLPPRLLRALAPLPGTEEELRTVSDLLGAEPGTVHVGAKVSEGLIRDLPLDEYKIIYFATHGLLPGELKCAAEPGLALSPPSVEPDSKANDGLLDASEIASLTLNADMVVLSACNTGGDGASGKLGGESLSGLARAFFYAGARAMLVSHWQVSSEATINLMTDLFQRMAGGVSRQSAEALRQAQMAVASDPANAHPFFWGAFTLVGDGRKQTNLASVAQ